MFSTPVRTSLRSASYMVILTRSESAWPAAEALIEKSSPVPASRLPDSHIRSLSRLTRKETDVSPAGMVTDSSRE